MELKDSESLEFMIGFLSLVIFSKEIFKSNFELSEFIKDAFKIEYKRYVVSSRTLMFSRLAKDIVRKYSDGNHFTAKNTVVNIIYEKLDQLPINDIALEAKKKENKKRKGKNTTTESISKWIKGFRVSNFLTIDPYNVLGTVSKFKEDLKVIPDQYVVDSLISAVKKSIFLKIIHEKSLRGNRHLLSVIYDF
ncbi:hypothetical protein IC611_09125 [Proteus mirabilis]